MNIIGLHTSFNSKTHDPSVALIVDGQLVFAIEEERLNRIKTSMGYFPERAFIKCLEKSSLTIHDIDLVVSDGITSPFLKNKIKDYIKHIFGYCPAIKLYDHSTCHNYSSYFISGFNSSLTISVDGQGDGISTNVSYMNNSNNKYLYNELYKSNNKFSLGNFYTAFTNYLGFRSVEGEYKVMGMAAYGKPKIDLSSIINFNNITEDFEGKNYNSLFNIDNYTSITEPSYNEEFIYELTKIKRLNLSEGEEFTQDHFDLAASVQYAFETNYINLISHFVKKTNAEYLCLSGGCALNCLANKNIKKLGLKDYFIMPASSDRGISVGAAAIAAIENNDLTKKNINQNMYLGISYTNNDIVETLNLLGINFIELNDLYDDCLTSVNDGKIVGWHQGRSEFGPRALGARSIIASPSIRGMKDKINSKIKFREKFRPFAPAILDTELSQYFQNTNQLKFMTFALDTPTNLQRNIQETVHHDKTSRSQSVNENDDIYFYNLLNNFKKKSIFPSVINTSFNVNGEPIVETPLDAIRTFYGSGIEVLYINNIKINK